jgi:hypothetical protein
MESYDVVASRKIKTIKKKDKIRVLKKKRKRRRRKEAATLIVQKDANIEKETKKKRTDETSFATTPEQATTTWQTFSTRIGVSHLHLVPRKRSLHLHETVCFPFEIGKTKQEKKVGDFHDDDYY